jgi:RND family efflux transporter MFP subunit
VKIEKARHLKLGTSINRDREIAIRGKTAGIPAGILFLVALVIIGWFLWPEQDFAPARIPDSNGEQKQDTVGRENKPAHARMTGESDAVLVLPGYVEPAAPYPVKITPLVPGRIDTFVALEGQKVAAGDVIAKLNTEAHETLARELKAALLAGEHRLDLATKEWKRTRELHQKGASTTRDLDQRLADLSILRAEQERLKAELDSVEWKIRAADVCSPVDGILYERIAQVGDYINLDERSEIASVHHPEKIQIWVDVNQREAGRVQPGQSVSIELDALPDRIFTGRVARILPRASMARNTVRCIIELEETAPEFRPEMSVKATFPAP